MAEWKKVVVSGSDISQLNNDSGYLTDAYNGFATASLVFTGGANLINASSPTSSLTFASASGQGLTISVSTLGTGQPYAGGGFTFGLSDIPNSSLENSSIMFDGQSYALGATGSILDGSGIWSGSAQLPDNILSSSAQIAADISGSLSNTAIAALGVGIVSGAAVTFNEQGAFTASFNGVETPIDLGLMVDDSPTFVDLTLTGDLSVAGDLIVNGELTYLNVANLQVQDQFILLNSGSNTGDGGIVVQSGSQGEGELFGWDYSSRRWGFGTSFDATGTFGENAGAYTTFAAQIVTGSTGNPNTGGTISHEPINAGGNIFIGDAGSIWIYS